MAEIYFIQKGSGKMYIIGDRYNLSSESGETASSITIHVIIFQIRYPIKGKLKKRHGFKSL